MPSVVYSTGAVHGRTAGILSEEQCSSQAEVRLARTMLRTTMTTVIILKKLNLNLQYKLSRGTQYHDDRRATKGLIRCEIEEQLGCIRQTHDREKEGETEL